MDNALSSDRKGGTGSGGTGGGRPHNTNNNYERRDYNSNRGGGGGGRFQNQNRTGGGGGGYRGGGYGNRSGGGGGRDNRYNNNQNQNRSQQRQNRGGGGGNYHIRSQGNRFYANEHQQQHPQERALQDLLQMVNKIGEYTMPVVIKKPEADDDNDPSMTTTKTTTEKDIQSQVQREVIQVQASNIMALTNVICQNQSNIQLFLQYYGSKTSASSSSSSFNNTSSNSISIEKWYGPMVTNIIHCQSVWPLQTPCYTTLTLAIQSYSSCNQHSSSTSVTATSQPPTEFAERCVQYATLLLLRDLDLLLLDCNIAQTGSGNNNNVILNPLTEWTRTLTRVRLTLRYLAQLANVQIVQLKSIPNDDDHNDTNGTNEPSTIHFMNVNEDEMDIHDLIQLVQSSLVTGSTSGILSFSFLGFLKLLVYAAVQAANQTQTTTTGTGGGGEGEKYKNTALLLASIVWSVIPYLVKQSGVSVTWIMEHLVTPLEEFVASTSATSSYQSPYCPGMGGKAILLQTEQLDENNSMVMDDNADEDHDEDEEDEDEEDDASGQVCDTLQDLLRTIKHLLLVQQQNSDVDQNHSNPPANKGVIVPMKFALFSDAPWETLKNPPTRTTVPTSSQLDSTTTSIKMKEEEEEEMVHDGQKNDDGDMDTDEKNTAAVVAGEEENKEVVVQQDPLSYSGKPLRFLSIVPTCKSLLLLLLGPESGSTSTGGSGSTNICKLANTDLNGAVFGRLPIFGSPPDLVNEEDDDDEEEDEEEEEANKKAVTGGGGGAQKNERLMCYEKSFGLIDRYFIGEAIRDIFLCHESFVSEVGVERGSAKHVAEQLWSLRFVMKNQENIDDNENNHDAAKGIEYIIIENILSLIAQNSKDSPFFLIYLSRVLLELTRLEPSIISPAIALAVSTLFQDYMPTLVPRARYNLCCWFAFHLMNTDYQWPVSYWKLYEPFVLQYHKSHGGISSGNSRSAFVVGTIALLVENVSEPSTLITNCLPKGSTLGDYLLPKILLPEGGGREGYGDVVALEELEQNLCNRIWCKDWDDTDVLLGYLLGDEISESISSTVRESMNLSRKMKLLWRTGVVIRALLTPAKKEYVVCRESIDRVRSSSTIDGIVVEGGDTETQSVGNHVDVATVLEEMFVRYQGLVQGIITKDVSVSEDSSEMQIFAEIFVLEQIESYTHYSRALFEQCIRSCLSCHFVQVTSVLKFLLGDNLDQDGTVTLRWWEFAIFVIQHTMFDIVQSTTNRMDVDDGSNHNRQQKAGKVINFLEPVLTYCVRRVCTLLNQTNMGKRNHQFTPEQVDLIEGLKYVITDTYALFFFTLQHDQYNTSSRTELKDMVMESNISGPKLAGLIDYSVGSVPLELVRRCLESL